MSNPAPFVAVMLWSLMIPILAKHEQIIILNVLDTELFYLFYMDKQRLTAENGRLLLTIRTSRLPEYAGPVLLQDPWYTEKIAHFDREVIPERRMHAKGRGHSELSP